MTVLYVLSDSVMGGATHSVLSIIEEMCRRGNRVIVVSPNMYGYLKERLNSLQVEWHVVPLCFKAYPDTKKHFLYRVYSFVRMLIVDFFAVCLIKRIIRKEKVSLVHTNVGPVACGYEACRKLGVPHVWHIREYGDKDFNIRMFPSKSEFRKWLSDSYVISITKDLIKYNGLEGSPSARVIYNGVRKESDIRFEYGKEKFFLCASRISPEKGFEQIIRVFAKFHNMHPDYRLIILGLEDKKYKNKLVGLVDSLDLGQSVRFEGYREDVSEYMARARALLVASPNEGFGRMTAEAAFAGCLVIGKNSAGTKEIMDITGGYPFINDDELLESMTEVLRLSAEEYRSKAITAQKKAILYFSEEKYVDNVCNLYDSILQDENKIAYSRP